MDYYQLFVKKGDHPNFHVRILPTNPLWTVSEHRGVVSYIWTVVSLEHRSEGVLKLGLPRHIHDKLVPLATEKISVLNHRQRSSIPILKHLIPPKVTESFIDPLDPHSGLHFLISLAGDGWVSRSGIPSKAGTDAEIKGWLWEAGIIGRGDSR